MLLEQKLLKHLCEEVRDVVGAWDESNAHGAAVSELAYAHVTTCDVPRAVRRCVILRDVDALRIVDVAFRRLQLL